MKHLFAFLILTSMAYAGDFTNQIALEAALVSMENIEVSKVPRSKCDVCKGTGKVKAGDGVTIVTRECDNCYPEAGAKIEWPKFEWPKIEIQLKEEPPKEEPPKEEPPVHEPKIQLILFTASWCGPCHYFHNTTIPQLKKEKGPRITEVDYDTNAQLAKKHNITLLPTLLILVDDIEIKRQTGGMTAQQVKSWCTSARLEGQENKLLPFETY